MCDVEEVLQVGRRGAQQAETIRTAQGGHRAATAKLRRGARGPMEERTVQAANARAVARSILACLRVYDQPPLD